MNNAEWVGRYLSLGWRVVPIRPRSKEFKLAGGWPAQRERTCTLADFEPQDNVGFDPASAGYVDVDLDALEAVALGAHFLPATGLVFGRFKKPSSHRFYKCADLDSDVKLTTGEGEVILELRTGAAGHTRIPPGVHLNDDKTEEAVQWSTFEPENVPDVEGTHLRRSAALLASACVIARAWPEPGARHEWSLSLWGALKQMGVSREEAERLVVGICIIVDEPKRDDRILDLRSTYNKAEEAAIRGFSDLKKRSPKLVRDLVRFLGDTITSRGFILNPMGKVASVPRNWETALNKLEIKLSYNRFSRHYVLRQGDRERVLIDEVVRRIRYDCDKKFGMFPPKDEFTEFIYDTGWSAQFHPVVDYLEKLSWDRKPRLDTWLVDYCGAENKDYTREVGRLPLLAAIVRVLHPGAKFDELLVLESKQGSGKSTAVAALCPKREWFSDDLPLGADSQKVIERTKGKWIIEVAELFGLGKRELDQIKGFLSRGVDLSRKAYGREPEEVARQWVAIGTTNKPEYLRDSTGNRRFWPVRVADEGIKTTEIARDRDQIWAEAFEIVKNSEHWAPLVRMHRELYAAAAEEQADREVQDPWEEELMGVLEEVPERFQAGKTNSSLKDPDKVRFTLGELWEVLSVPIERRDVRGQERLTAILQKNGFTKMRIRRGDRLESGWGRDDRKKRETDEDIPF